MATPTRQLTLLAPTTLAAAVTGVASTPVTGLAGMQMLCLEGICVVAGGGTTCKVWVQTSLDGGGTWVDIANFAFTTTTASKLAVVTLTPATPFVAGTAPGSGTLADNTVLAGLLGDRLRTLLTTTGTYTGASSIAVYGVTH